MSCETTSISPLRAAPSVPLTSAAELINSFPAVRVHDHTLILVPGPAAVGVERDQVASDLIDLFGTGYSRDSRVEQTAERKCSQIVTSCQLMMHFARPSDWLTLIRVVPSSPYDGRMRC